MDYTPLAFAAGCWFAAFFFRDLLTAGKIIARKLTR